MNGPPARNWSTSVRLRHLSAIWLAGVLTLAGAATSAGAHRAAAVDPARPAIVDPTVAAREAALHLARLRGERVPIDALTSPTAQAWALPNGHIEAEIDSGVARVLKNGRWVPVDLRLTRLIDGSLAPVQHPGGLVFSGAATRGEHELASVGNGDARVTMGWSGSLPEPVLSDVTATYPEVFPGVDLVAQVLRDGYEVSLVVKNRAGLGYVARAEAALRLYGTRTPEGGLVHRGRRGGVVGATAPPLMWDATRDPRTGTPAHVAPVQLRTRPGGTDLMVSADEAWLNDPARTFPITIDPSAYQQNGGYDTWVNSSNPSTNYGSATELEIGTQNSGSTKRLAYITFPVGLFAGARITYANLKVWGTYVASGGVCSTGVWQLYGTQYNVGTGTVWNNRPNLVDGNRNVIDQNGVDDVSVPFGGNLTPASGGCTGQWMNSSATSLFQWAADRAAADSNFTTMTAALRPYWDDTNVYYKRFKSQNSGTLPHVIVDYWFPPTVSAPSTNPATTCTTGAGRPAIGTTTPQLSITASQPDGIASDDTFEWWEVGTSTVSTQTVTGVVNGQPGTVTVPAGNLLSGRSYAWHARAASVTAGTSAWSATCEFVVDAPAAAVAGCATGFSGGGDFNGDGVRDVVIADPQATVNAHPDAGSISIVDGASSAVTVLHQDLAAVPGAAESGAQFGFSIAAYDLNKDGCADLAIGVPYADAGTVTDSGTVFVLYGSPAGLGQGPAAEVYEQGLGRTPGAKVARDYFGYALAASQSSAGNPYLVIGAPGDDVGTATDAGTVTYLGLPNRIAFAAAAYSVINSDIDERFGYALAATPNHFAVGRPGKTSFAGKVCVFTPVLTAGLPTMFTCLDQDTSGVSDQASSSDGFGSALSMAPYRAPGQPAGSDSILAVGVPGEDAGGVADSGLVQEFQLTGTATATELAAVSEASLGLTAAPGDLFGQRVQLVNTAPGSAASPATLQLAVGAPGRDSGSIVDAGMVVAMPAGTSSTGGRVIVQRSAGGLPGVAQASELIGIALGTTSTELLVAAPYGSNQGVYAIRWADLAAGTGTPARTWMPTNGVAFGAQVG